MIWEEEPKPGPGVGHEVAKAVAIAALSALATGLVTWGIEALKELAKPKDPESRAP